MDSSETTGSSLRGETREQEGMEPVALSWVDEQHPASHATSAERESTLLSVVPSILQNGGSASHQPKDRPSRTRVHTHAVRSTHAREDGGPATERGCRSSARFALSSEAAEETQTVSLASATATTTPQRTSSSLAQKPPPKHSSVLSFCQSVPHQLPLQAPGISGGGGGGGGYATVSVEGESRRKASTAAATSEVINTTPGIFPASQWVQATLGGTATRSHFNKETATVSLSRLQSRPVGFRKNPPAAQVAAQLHERREAAALQSQKEMREFTAIMRRIEATGGSDGVRQLLQQRWKRYVGGSAVSAVGSSVAPRGGGERGNRGRQQPHQRRRREPCDGAQNGGWRWRPAAHLAKTSGGYNTVSGPSDQLLRHGSAGLGDGDCFAMNDEGTDNDEASTFGTFSETSELAEGDYTFTISSPYCHTGSAAGSVQAKRAPRRRYLARRPAKMIHQRLSASSSELAAAANMSRVEVYKLHDRTARGWVVLQHRRVAHMRAGTPVLQREVQASQQRLLHAHKGNAAKSGGPGAQVQAVPRKTALEADIREEGLMSVTGLQEGTPKHFQMPVAGNLMALTVSWSGIPDYTQSHSDGAGDDDDGTASDFLSVKQSVTNGKRATQLSDVYGEADGVSEDKTHESGSSGGDASLVQTEAQEQGITPLAPSSSILSNRTLCTANAPTPTSCSHSLGDEVATLEKAPDNSPTRLSVRAPVAAAVPEVAANTHDEQLVRNELQKRLAQADECGIYGLRNALRGTQAGSSSKSARTAVSVTDSGVAVGGADAATIRSPGISARRRHLGAGTTSLSLRPATQQPSSRRTPTPTPSIITTRNAALTSPVSAEAAVAQERRAGTPPSVRHSYGSSKWPKCQGGTQVGGDPANSTSVLSSITASPLSVPLLPLAGGMTASDQSNAAMAQTTCSSKSILGAQTSASGLASPSLLPQSGRPQRNNSFRRRKKPHRRKPLPPVIGVGQHSAALFQHELLTTRRCELDADQAHAHDIECTCVMLQRLRPLREQLMLRDTCPRTGRTGGGEPATKPPPTPLLIMSGSTPVSQVAEAPETALSNVSLSNIAAATTIIAAPPPRRRREADAAIARSHMPQAVLHRQRQLIYDEAVRLDAQNRLEARTAYLDALTQLAHKNVSSVSWPAVSALLSELRERLQREAQLSIRASSATRDGADGKPTVQTTAISSSSSAFVLKRRQSTAEGPDASSGRSSPLRNSAVPQANLLASPSPAQQYGGLQQLINAHLGVLELTQWPVQEVLQHLGALYGVPLSLLQEWMAEQQQRYSHSYSYEERFLAVDSTIAGRAFSADTLLRLTLHRCRQPPLGPLQGSLRTAGNKEMRDTEDTRKQQPFGEEEGLYYIRVRSAARSVASTAVPLSWTTPFAGAAASARTLPTSPDKGSRLLPMQSLSTLASYGSTPPPSLSARALNFLGQILVLPLLSATATASDRSRDQWRCTTTRGAFRCRSDGVGGHDADAEMDNSVLAVELLQEGGTAPLACGELNLRRLGLSAHSTTNGSGGRQRAQNVQIELRRKGYRSAMLRATLELL
ncbi:hypothetical protein, conserved [Leishmania tarentolae]|uniref:Uncharacterized protein n=1 Tax=Leishmania tarentolae TaxID=5689 RepID=A0A640K984_LEITA|nr:hypothetical protein, conserved [Leishmania tarentolae]